MQCGRPGFDPWVRKIPWRREWQHTPVFLPEEFHGQGSLAGYSSGGYKELDTTEQLYYYYYYFLSLAGVYRSPGGEESWVQPGCQLLRFCILNGPYRVIFIQHEVALHLGRTDLRCSLTDTVCKGLSQGSCLPGVEPLEHLGQHILLHVYSPGAYQGRVKPVDMVGGHEYYACFGGSHTVQGVEQPAEGEPA